jgi:hypothetical protein
MVNPTRSTRSARRRLLACTGAALIVVATGLAPVAASAQEADPERGATTTTAPIAVVDRAPLALAPSTDPDGGATTSAEDDRLTATASDVEPFTMIGLAGRTATPDEARIRLHTADGWGEWEPITFDEHAGPAPDSDEGRRAADATGGVPVGDPIWVGSADGYELEVPGDTTDAAVLVVREHDEQVEAPADTSGQALPLQGRPNINPRTSWGARAPKVAPIVAPALRVAIVHHSVSTNAYSPGEVPSILRSIQAFHMDGRGWDDIGYNFAIDRFGGIWEARSGGTERAVIGAHAFEDNYESTGVVGIGEFDSAGPTPQMLASYGQLIGWKMELHGWSVDQPWNGHPAVVGHRDVNETACPGQLLWNQLGTIRDAARAKQFQMRATPGFWGTAAIHRNDDGRPEVFALGNDNTIWHNWQVGNSWSGWYPLLSGVSGNPTIIANGDGRLEVFAVGTNGNVVHRWQMAPNSGWGPTHAFSGTASPTSGVAAESNTDGRIEIFAVHDDDVLYHMYQNPWGGWSQWYPLGEGFPSNAGLDAIRNTDGRLEIFANADGHVLKHSYQIVPNSGWSPLRSLGMPANGGPSVARNADGRLEAFGVDDNGVLWHVWQILPNSAWGAPATMLAGLDYGSSVKAYPNANGRLQLFGTTSNDVLLTMQQASSGWGPVGQINGQYITGPTDAVLTADNRMVVAGMQTNGANVSIAWQTSPAGAWSTLVGI